MEVNEEDKRKIDSKLQEHKGILERIDNEIDEKYIGILEEIGKSDRIQSSELRQLLDEKLQNLKK
jgi:hypothetical protein